MYQGRWPTPVEAIADTSFSSVLPSIGECLQSYAQRQEVNFPIPPFMVAIGGVKWVGKTTIMEALVAMYPTTYVIANKHTNREARRDDKQNVVYMSREQMIANGFFVRDVAGYSYGLDLEEVSGSLKKGIIPLVDVDCDSFRVLRNNLAIPMVNTLFLPDNLAAWQARREERNSANLVLPGAPDASNKLRDIAENELIDMITNKKNFPSLGVDLVMINPQGQVEQATRNLHGVFSFMQSGDPAFLES